MKLLYSGTRAENVACFSGLFRKAGRVLPCCVLLHHLLLVSLFSFWSSQAHACGGFFCQNLPINQAGEQIVFRQEGSTVTAMIRILYSGDAEDFSWVVPVPNMPDLSVGSDQFFDQLDLATRPQFILDRQGQECFVNIPLASVDAVDDSGAVAESSDGLVTVIDQVVGPFDVQTLQSDDPGALADWLAENDYDLTDRGEELIAPYIDEGMQFVAVKLRSGQSTGSIKPLIMSYQSETPVIPIRLTAVAAQEDMGVLVWVVADARAVPDNYLHVIPNYGRLNWFTGPFNAYASYQALVTAAMEEAGGQGFATDYAGAVTSNITSAFFSPDNLQSVLDSTSTIQDDARFIAELLAQLPQQQEAFDFLQTALPLPGGFDQFAYFDPISLQVAFETQQLSDARSAFSDFVVNSLITPLREAIALVPEGAYMTRLFTTISPEDMTVDPEFVFNSAMPEQPINRRALLELACTDAGTEWQLTLGEGTGRDGELVAQGLGPVAPVQPLPIILEQPAVFRSEDTSAADLPVAVTTNALTAVANAELTAFPAIAVIDDELDDGDSDGGFLGAGGGLLWVSLFALLFRRRFVH